MLWRVIGEGSVPPMQEFRHFLQGTSLQTAPFGLSLSGAFCLKWF